MPDGTEPTQRVTLPAQCSPCLLPLPCLSQMRPQPFHDGPGAVRSGMPGVHGLQASSQNRATQADLADRIAGSSGCFRASRSTGRARTIVCGLQGPREGAWCSRRRRRRLSATGRAGPAKQCIRRTGGAQSVLKEKDSVKAWDMGRRVCIGGTYGTIVGGSNMLRKLAISVPLFARRSLTQTAGCSP